MDAQGKEAKILKEQMNIDRGLRGKKLIYTVQKLANINRIIPNCTTVVQTANYPFEPEIQLNLPQK